MSEPKEYRKKPVTVRAMQVTDDTVVDVMQWIMSNGGDYHTTTDCVFKIKTLEGWYPVNLTDWVVQGIVGEFHPVRADIFAETYGTPDEVPTIEEVGRAGAIHWIGTVIDVADKESKFGRSILPSVLGGGPQGESPLDRLEAAYAHNWLAKYRERLVKRFEGEREEARADA